MEVNKAETPEDEREISLNESSLKKPLGVIDVIGGHGPWQFRQWIVFLLASLCNSAVVFSVLFLPSQTFCSSPNSTGLQATMATLLEMNNTAAIQESGNLVKRNDSFHTETFTNIINCNLTSCKTDINGSSDIYSSKIFNDQKCWNSRVDVLARCCYFISCFVSGVLVYLSNNRFGWRSASILSSIILVASFVGTSWAGSSAVYLILRFIFSLCIVNIYLISAFSLLKYVHEDFKLLYFLTGHLGWGMGHFLLPAIVWLAEDWKSFNIILGTISLLMSFFVWLSPDSPSSFPKGGELTRTRQALKYAAFTNGYSTTDVDLLSHNSYGLHQENKHEFRTLASTKAKILFIVYSSALFLISFTTAFLYFSTKWHPEWFKVKSGRIRFSFLGTTEVASTVILLFLTCFVAIKYLWAIVSAVLAVSVIIIFSRNSEGSTKSSAYLYIGTAFFAAAAFTLVITKLFCQRISSYCAKCNLIVTGVAVLAGSLAASAVNLKADNQDMLLLLGVPHLLLAVTTVFLPENFFGRVS